MFCVCVFGVVWFCALLVWFARLGLVVDGLGFFFCDFFPVLLAYGSVLSFAFGVVYCGVILLCLTGICLLLVLLIVIYVVVLLVCDLWICLLGFCAFVLVLAVFVYFAEVGFCGCLCWFICFVVFLRLFCFVGCVWFILCLVLVCFVMLFCAAVCVLLLSGLFVVGLDFAGFRVFFTGCCVLWLLIPDLLGFGLFA